MEQRGLAAPPGAGKEEEAVRRARRVEGLFEASNVLAAPEEQARVDTERRRERVRVHGDLLELRIKSHVRQNIA